jgi:hypothetical protein
LRLNRQALVRFSMNPSASGGWEQVRPDVEVKLVPTPQGEETYVLERSM